MVDDIARAGTLLLIERGAYDSYTIMHLCVVIKDFSPREVLEIFLQRYPEQREGHDFQAQQYVDLLLRRELIKVVDYGTLHVDSFGSTEYFEHIAASKVLE